MFPLSRGETVVRERAAAILDPYSEEITGRDWGNPALLTLEGVAIAPASTVETSADNRQMVVTGMSLYFATGLDVLPGDRVRARSGLWEVEGEVLDWHHPFTGWSPGSQVSIKKVVG